MWSPTHVQVIVQRARNLRIKGKHGVNDTYVTIQLGKEKFQTSVQQKTASPEWHEECELLIPDGNTSSITLALFHRNLVGLDKFLGRVDIPLQELDIYERSRNKWYSLQGKPNHNDNKVRGELEVCCAFIVKSVTGSLMDLSKKKHKSGSLPLKMVQSVGGSLMNLAGGKDKKFSLGQLKHSIGGKLSDKLPRKKSPLKDPAFVEENDVGLDDDQSFGEGGDYSDIDAVSIASSSHTYDNQHLTSSHGELPTTDKDLPLTMSPIKMERSSSHETFGLSSSPVHTSSIVESPVQTKTPNSDLIENNKYSNTLKDKNNGNNRNAPATQGKGTPSKNSHFKSARRQMNTLIAVENKPTNMEKKQTLEHNILNERPHLSNLAPREVMTLYEAMTKQELIELLCKQRALIDNQQRQINDLEDYIDNLLVRVMDSTPRILQNPYRNRKPFK